MKSKINLDDYFHLDISGDCVTLVHKEEGKVNKKTGKMVYPVNKWHCTSVKNALKRYCDVGLYSCDNLIEILYKIDQLNTKIDNLKL